MEILIAIAIVALIGLIIGLGLSIASTYMAVPTDERVEQLTAAMAGINCGACGYANCEAYATAIASGEETRLTLCSPGGPSTVEKLAAITGQAGGTFRQTVAVVKCQGSTKYTGSIADYDEPQSCSSLNQLQYGNMACDDGCLGLGECVEACPYDSIYMDHGVARVNPYTCTGCQICVKTCPKHLFAMVPIDELNAVVLCSNTEKGATTRKNCSVGCIGCRLCVKACEYDAITVTDNLATIDPDRCTACGKCIDVCPSHCIVMGPKDLVPEVHPHEGDPQLPPALVNLKKEQSA